MWYSKRAILMAAVWVTAPWAVRAVEGAALRVRALGCFFEIPASYTLIADPGPRVQLIAPGARGSVTIEPLSDGSSRRLSETASRVEGHLTVRELTDHDPKEPLRLIVIQNGLQSVTLRAEARALAGEIIGSCLANIHPGAPGAP